MTIQGSERRVESRITGATISTPRDCCQDWAVGPWVQEVGLREHELRNRGCRDAGGDVWVCASGTCNRRAYGLAVGGVIGEALTARLTAGGRRQDDDGAWR